VACLQLDIRWRSTQGYNNKVTFAGIQKVTCNRFSLFFVPQDLKCFYFHRRVQNESATGSVESHRVRTTLTITVETIDFDSQAGILRIKGRNIVENKYVKVKSMSCFIF